MNTRLLDQALSAGAAAGADFLEALKKQKEAGGTPPQAAAALALFLASGAAGHISGRTLSAVWDKEEKLSEKGWEADRSLYALRRIDNELYQQKRGRLK
ncbi:Uncharacterised protein [uncultured archaeon]|nr:Uncharacterised protein [uncultured archaeon]